MTQKAPDNRAPFLGEDNRPTMAWRTFFEQVPEAAQDIGSLTNTATLQDVINALNILRENMQDSRLMRKD